MSGLGSLRCSSHDTQLRERREPREARPRLTLFNIKHLHHEMYLLSKTIQAFQWTCETLFEQSDEVYFWTFTFKSVPWDDDYAMEQYAIFARRLIRHFSWIRGVRVCELHKSHGIHFHCLLNGRIPLSRMQRLWNGTGFLAGKNHYLDFGRASVDRCDDGTVSYLSKYMTKQYRNDNFFGNRRRWGTVGGLKPYRCRDIEYDSQALRNRREMFGQFACGYGAILMIRHYTELWGHWSKWPQEHQALVRRQPSNRAASEWINHMDDDGRLRRIWLRKHKPALDEGEFDAWLSSVRGDNYSVPKCYHVATNDNEPF